MRRIRLRSLHIILTGLLLAVIALWLRLQKGEPSQKPAAGAQSSSFTTPPASVATRAEIEPAELSARAQARLDEILAQLKASQDPASNRKLLSELRQFLSTLPPESASRELQRFLATNRDAATKLDVTIQLGDASSLRVFLLDCLGQIDRRAAGALAAQILSSYTTPDEWAVSLRNYAWANPGPGGDAYLLTKARELLANPLWRKDPSAGFLEAFDTIIYARGTALASELATMVRDKESRATAHAAYLTLDRLTITQPVAMLKQLVEQPDLMKGREQTRANYFARADVRQPDQRALVERYLLDPSHMAQELTTFSGIYPNANYMISNNLLTTTATPTHDVLVNHDAAALGIVREWLADPRFDNLKPQLAAMHARLETFVQQAASRK